MHMYREDSFQKPEQTMNACQTIVFASAGPFLMERVFVVEGGSHVIVCYELCRVWLGTYGARFAYGLHVAATRFNAKIDVIITHAFLKS